MKEQKISITIASPEAYYIKQNFKLNQPDHVRKKYILALSLSRMFTDGCVSPKNFYNI